MRLTYVALYCIRLVINEPVLVGPPTMPAVTPLGADKWLTGIWAQSLVYSAILRRILTVKAVCILFLTAVWWHNGHKKIVMPKATSARDTGTVPSLHLHNYYWPVGDRLIVWTSTGFWYLLQPLALQRQISIYNMEMNTFIFLTHQSVSTAVMPSQSIFTLSQHLGDVHHPLLFTQMQTCKICCGSCMMSSAATWLNWIEFQL